MWYPTVGTCMWYPTVGTCMWSIDISYETMDIDDDDWLDVVGMLCF